MPNDSIIHIHSLNDTKLPTSMCLFITEAILFLMWLHGLNIESVFCSQRSASLCIPFGCYFVRELITLMRNSCALNVYIEQRTILIQFISLLYYGISHNYKQRTGSMTAIISTRNNKWKRIGNGKEGKITWSIIVRVTVVSRYKLFLRIVTIYFNLSQFIDKQLLNQHTNTWRKEYTDRRQLHDIQKKKI